MKIFQRLILFSPLLFLLLSSCNGKYAGSGLKEGQVIYKVEYLEDKKDNPLISLLPNEIKMFFKNDNVAMDVEGWMGVFKSGFLRIGNSKKIYTLMKVLNKRYYYESVDASSYMGLSSMKDVEINFDDSVKTICDLACKHAFVKIPSKNMQFDLFYTEEIEIEAPNYGTPFSEIPGVLMEFQVEMHGIPMHIQAKQIQAVKVENFKFEIPVDYKNVDKAVVDELVASLIQ